MCMRGGRGECMTELGGVSMCMTELGGVSMCMRGGRGEYVYEGWEG